MMVDDVIVVGGGNAGYISALILRASFPEKNITVIQSDDIGIIGVGESSSEQFGDFCRYCRIPILDLILNAKATFKNGVYFEGWSDEDYLHNISVFDCASASGNHFPYLQKVVSERRPNFEMNPKGSVDNQVPLNYFSNLNNSPTHQFHFDTQALNRFLKELCELRDIQIVVDEIISIDINSESGDIDSVNGRKKYYADFFIDCSGFSRLLLGKGLGIKWKSYSEYLPLDSAIAFATEEMEEYNMYTKSTARDYGWSWQIPIQGRTGNGYVFCEKFINETQAHEEMERVYGKKLDIVKTFKFDPGRMEKAWYKNCYAVGLSQSFVEPLEATAIGSVIQQMYAFVHYLPSNSINECNTVVNNIFDNIFDYVQAHYLVKREDTPFWKDVKNNLKITPTLKPLLELWKNRFPQSDDCDCKFGLFTAVNYIPILYGLNWFDIDKVAKEYQYISHLNVNEWDKTKADTLYMGHKQFINESVKIYNLNKEK